LPLSQSCKERVSIPRVVTEIEPLHYTSERPRVTIPETYRGDCPPGKSRKQGRAPRSGSNSLPGQFDLRALLG